MTVLSDHTTAAGRIEKHDRLEGPQGRLWTVTDIDVDDRGRFWYSLTAFANSIRPDTRQVDAINLPIYYNLKG